MKIDELVQNPENERVLKSLLSVIEYESNLPLIYEELEKNADQINQATNGSYSVYMPT